MIFFRAVYELICDPQSTSIGESRRAVRAFKTFPMLHSKLIFIIMRLWKSYANNLRHARTHTSTRENNEKIKKLFAVNIKLSRIDHLLAFSVILCDSVKMRQKNIFAFSFVHRNSSLEMFVDKEHIIKSKEELS